MPVLPTDDLPFVDAHEVVVVAPPAAVWASLAGHITAFAPREAFARLVGAEPCRRSGTPLQPGATLPGFAIVEAEPDRRVRLAGRHHFSRYALTFTVEGYGDRTVLTAWTHAAFPGLSGRAYRSLVIGSGTHQVLVRRLLQAVRRDAESRR